MPQIEIDDETMAVLTAEAERAGTTPAELLKRFADQLKEPRGVS